MTFPTKFLRSFLGGLAAQNLTAMQEPQETRVRFLSQKDTLKKGTATHPRILAWRSPWTEEPGRLQSMGLQLK